MAAKLECEICGGKLMGQGKNSGDQGHGQGRGHSRGHRQGTGRGRGNERKPPQACGDVLCGEELEKGPRTARKSSGNRPGVWDGISARCDGIALDHFFGRSPRCIHRSEEYNHRRCKYPSRRTISNGYHAHMDG